MCERQCSAMSSYWSRYCCDPFKHHRRRIYSHFRVVPASLIAEHPSFLVSYPDPDSHSCGWITSPLRVPRSGDVIHPQLWESGSGYETTSLSLQSGVVACCNCLKAIRECSPESRAPDVPLLECAGPSNERAGSSNERAGPSNERAGPSNERAGPSNERAGPGNYNERVGSSDPRASPSAWNGTGRCTWVTRTNTFVARTCTFVARTCTFVARTGTFIARTGTFVARTCTFVARTGTFVARTSMFVAHSNKGTSGALDSGEHSRIAFGQLQQATTPLCSERDGCSAIKEVQLESASIYGADGA